MYSKREQHQVNLHFDKPIDELTPQELDKVWGEAQKLGEKFGCKRVYLQTSKKTGYKTLTLICSLKPELKENK